MIAELFDSLVDVSFVDVWAVLTGTQTTGTVVGPH